MSVLNDEPNLSLRKAPQALILVEAEVAGVNHAIRVLGGNELVDDAEFAVSVTDQKDSHVSVLSSNRLASVIRTATSQSPNVELGGVCHGHHAMTPACTELVTDKLAAAGIESATLRKITSRSFGLPSDKASCVASTPKAPVCKGNRVGHDSLPKRVVDRSL